MLDAGAARAGYFIERMWVTAAFSSASVAVTFGCPLASFRAATRALESLPLAAMSLYAGPTFFLSASWQLLQPLAFSTSGPDWASPAPAASAPAAARTASMVFIAETPPWVRNTTVSVTHAPESGLTGLTGLT